MSLKANIPVYTETTEMQCEICQLSGTLKTGLRYFPMNSNSHLCGRIEYLNLLYSLPKSPIMYARQWFQN